MARMIPSGGPQDNDSFAEGLIYGLLKAQLDDRFTVIHSLPWLCSKAKEIDDSYAPTGEIDFLILHPELGALALEVKGGRYRVSGLRLVHIKKGYSISPVRQTRRNVHGLGSWLGSDPDLRIRIGYGLVFPDSTFGDATVSAALNDVSVTPPESIVIDMGDIPKIGERVVELMKFWSRANRTGPLSSAGINKLVEKLCPAFDGTPTWGARIMYDNQLWLQLTSEQSVVVKRAISAPRMVIAGWPGTGKTLVGIACARESANSGKPVLFLTFNNLLARYLEQQFAGESSVTVYTWHKFCWEMRRRLPESERQPAEKKDALWPKAGCSKDLALASTRGLLDDFGLIVVDEAQALRPDWWEILVAAFKGNSIIAMCDETQVFPFEKETTALSVLCEKLSVSKAFALTIALRNPRAVTDRLQTVVSPEYQLTSPRQFEGDSIREIVTKKVWTTVFELIESLTSDGVQANDIAVLTKYPTAYESELSKLGVFYELVSRFRGLESPIVIVPNAEELHDVEIFCAYSRTTSACIALYDAEVLGWADELGRFATSLLSLPENRRLADEARLNSTTAHQVATFLDPVNQFTKSVNLAWTSVWNGWLVELDTDHDDGEIWPEFLVSAFGWPVYLWRKDDCRKIVRVSPDTVDANDARFEYGLTTLFCFSCEMLAPHTFSPKDGYECRFCSGAYSRHRPPPSAEIFQKIKAYDAILTSKGVMTSTSPEVSRLPLALIALACLREIDLSKIPTDKHPQVRSGSPIYRRALAMLYWQIHTRPDEKLVTAELAERWHTKFHSIQEMDLKDWKSKVAMAVSTCNMRKLIVAERKGVYRVLHA